MNFIFDIDGTICFKGQPVSPKILNALAEIKEAGHLVGFASARACRDMLPVLDERFHDSLLIGANGAMTYFNGKLEYFSPLPPIVYKQVMVLMERYKASYFLDLAWDYYYEGRADHPFLTKVDPGKLGRKILKEDIDQAAKILVTECSDITAFTAELARLEVQIHHHSDEELVDMTSAGVDKMSALRQFGIAKGDFVCFGNDTNDLPLFHAASHSVLVGSHPELSHCCTQQITLGSQLEDELVQTLYQLQNNEKTNKIS